ncbi:MAG: hypothetical protein NTX22_04490 [Ignavibacteriales bacterium]|nr:hypothetical protein [Ignavibacteriales bacterium]
MNIKSRSTIIIAGIIFLFNIILLFFPLVNILGYESAVLNAVLLAFLSGIYSIKLFKSLKEEYNHQHFFHLLLNGLLTFLLIPILIFVVASFFILNCSLVDGFIFYLVLTIPSAIIGCCLGIISFEMLNRFQSTFFILTFFIILFLPILDIFYNCQIYFYNPFIGFFPGTIYDESIYVDWRLISYRILNLIYFVGVAAVFFRIDLLKNFLGKYSKIAITLTAIVVASIFFLFNQKLSYSENEMSIAETLGGNLETEHFNIFYDNSINKKKLELIGLSCEYYYEIGCEYFKVKPQSKITAFIFLDSEQKRKLIGAGNADVAKPWLNQVYIEFENYESTLQHEIAHCLTSEFGVTPFKISASFNAALLEGIASASVDISDEHSLHYLAKLAYNNGIWFPLSKLFSGLNFFNQLSTLSYIYSGSFVKFLVDKYGIDNFKKIYSGEDFLLVYKKSINNLEKEYLAFLKAQNFKNNKHEALLYFGRKPIFKKVCARFLAEQMEIAGNKFNSGNFKEAKIKFKQLSEYSDSYGALVGYINCLSKLNEDKSALKTLQSNISKYDSTSYIYNLQLLLADQCVLNKKLEMADSIYSVLINENSSPRFLALTLTRKNLIKDSTIILSYLKGSNFDKFEILKQLNRDSIVFATIPLMINLSADLHQNYNSFIKLFESVDKANNFISSYGLRKLSGYAFNNLDFDGAKQFAVKALNYKEDLELNEVIKTELKRANWFYNFAPEVQTKFIWKK